jgi:RecA/RadA recombinase
MQHGVDPELMLLQRPVDIDEGMDMLHDLVYENLVDYIVFDSIGALAAKSAAAEDGKMKAYGASPVITSGLNAVMPRLWRNNIGLLLINQQRQDTKGRKIANVTMYDSPGGEALHHHMAFRIHLKPGRTRYVDKIDGEEVVVGRELIASFMKNKLAMNSKAARFEFWFRPVEKYGWRLGIDKAEDIIRTGKASGVIKGASWLEHPAFPDGKVHGKPGLETFLHERPEVEDRIREEVLTKMRAEQVEAYSQARNATAKVQTAPVPEETDDDN